MTIIQEISIDAPADKVFGILTDAEQFGAATGAPADFDAQDGGALSAFGGMITGRFVEITPGERVVQAWRAKPWAPGVFSMVKFSLKSSGSTTIVTLEQSGYPEGEKEHLEGGWSKMYWEPIKAYLK